MQRTKHNIKQPANQCANQPTFTPRLRHASLLALLLLPYAAQATNGYFSSGYGIKAQGLAGAGIALPQDALAAATNPAGTSAVGERADLGLTVFVPKRSADIVGNGFGADQSYSGDGTSGFVIPEFAFTRRINAQTSWGLAVYGNGGFNTDYASNPFARFGASGSAGISLEQLIITPSVAYKLYDAHTVGVALNIAYQQFSAKGISPFAASSVAPNNVSDKGVDSSTGAGVRLGWTGKLTPSLTLGATWASKIDGKFDKYKGLFADGGTFDIPENYGVGLAFEVTPAWTVAADVQTIRYSQVSSVGNSVASLFNGSKLLGSAGGPGFGWRDQTIVKIGVNHQYNKDLVLRAGVSVGDQPVPAGETFFNILAPGVVQNHLTLGATWTTASGGEWSGFYARAFGQSVAGSNAIPGTPTPPTGYGGGNVNLHLQEDLLGVSYGWKF
jgi:long-chain fatty acid transport protein